MPTRRKPVTTETAATESFVADTAAETLPSDDINLISNPESPDVQEQARAPRRGRRPKPAPEEIDLDPKYLNDPHAMNYGLLLALLMREGGRVSLTNAELNNFDTEHNVLFTLSLDRTTLEVSVVSSESGIIRSPEAKWALNDQLPPLMPAATSSEAEKYLAEMAQRHGIGSQMPPDPDGRIHEMPNPAMGPRLATQSQEHPPPNAQQPNPERKVPILPFTVGDSPATAEPMNLNALTSELQRDRLVASQERAAAERAGQMGS